VENRIFQLVSSDALTATVLIDGYIGGHSDNSHKRIIRELEGISKKHSKIKFLINSNGGSVPEGVAIYNAVKDLKAETTGVVVGVAASMAFVLLQAFDHRGMRNMMTRAMSHKLSGGAVGSAKQLKSTAEFMEKWEKDIVAEIAERSGNKKEEVQAWFAEDVDKWFTPKEMLEKGLIDFIEDKKSVEQPPQNLNAEELMAHFQNSIRNEITGGRRLSAMLNRLIDEMADEDDDRSAILRRMASSAGISEETLTSILSGRIDFPPIERLRGFARVLKVSEERLRRVAEQDGCNYENSNNTNNSKMKKEQLALIGLSEGASDEAIEAKLTELVGKADKADKAEKLIENNAKNII